MIVFAALKLKAPLETMKDYLVKFPASLYFYIIFKRLVKKASLFQFVFPSLFVFINVL